MSRKNTHNVDDLIENPASIIESIIRDEILTERDLTISGASGADVEFTNLNVSKADYYNSSILVNATKSARYFVSDDNGAGTLTLTDAHSWDIGDKCYIKNIRGNDFIDTDSFDVISSGTVESGTTSSATANKLIQSGQNFQSTVLPGMIVKNTTDTTYSYVQSVDSDTQLTLTDDIMASGENYLVYGMRSGWKFRRSITSQQNSQDLIRQLCYESNTMLVRSYKKYRLIALEGGNIAGTLSLPDIENGQPQIFSELTSLLGVYTDFTLNYGYDYTKKTYAKRLFVNKNATSDASLDDLKTNCASAETNYKIKNKWEYSADWIDDDTTAIYFLTMMIQKLTYQRMLVKWTGDIKNHFQYEVGDKVLLNYGTMLPYGKNNSTVFLITGRTFDFKKKVVRLNLLY